MKAQRTQRKTYSAEFKSKVALEAIRGFKTINELAAEFGFHPEACAPAAGNQKGAVENLVGYVKSNFLAGRIFHDDWIWSESVPGGCRR